jgi:hypothetical protein
MDSNQQNEIKHLRQRLEILDKIIAGLEELAAHSPYPNLALPRLRLYKCDDRGSSNGRVRRARRAASLGANLG